MILQYKTSVQKIVRQNPKTRPLLVKTINLLWWARSKTLPVLRWKKGTNDYNHYYYYYYFCQIQKYLKLIKVHSLVYKWFLHCYICIQKSFYMLKVTCTKPDKKGSLIHSEQRKKVSHKNNNIKDSPGKWFIKIINWAIISLHFANNGQPACLEHVFD